MSLSWMRHLHIAAKMPMEILLCRWKKVEPLVKSYLGNTLHLLGKCLKLCRLP